MKTCKYGHPWIEGAKYCVTCKTLQGQLWRKRVDAKIPVYAELARKPWVRPW